MTAYLQGKKLYLIAIASLVAMVWNAMVGANFDLRAILAHMDWPHVMEALGAVAMRAGIAKMV